MLKKRVSIVYCAGGLFRPGERWEMANIAEKLEKSGFGTLLPQRDGFEFTAFGPELSKQGFSEKASYQLWEKAIYAYDLFCLLSADVTVFNTNGPVMDDGAIMEFSTAAATGRGVVLFNDDSRALYDGRHNPMITGISDFQIIRDLDELPKAVHNEMRNHTKPIAVDQLPARYQKPYALGAGIQELKNQGAPFQTICQYISENCNFKLS